MNARAVRSLAAAVVASVLLAGCLGPSQEDYDLATAVALQTEQAPVPSRTPQPTATSLPPSATPDSVTTTFSDPSGDLISCQTGEPAQGNAVYFDIGQVRVSAGVSGLTVEAEFPQTDDLLENFTFPGSFLGVLVFDDPNNPFDQGGDIGLFSMGTMRQDAIWDGQELGGRTFLRGETGSYLEAENVAEVSAMDNRLQIYISPRLAPLRFDRAGFAAVTPDGCDLAGIEFDYSSGTADHGELTLDVREVIEFFDSLPPG